MISQIPAFLAASVTIVLGVVISAVEPGIGDAVLNEYGPIGVAVLVLYRRIDKLEERVETNRDRVETVDDQLEEVKR